MYEKSKLENGLRVVTSPMPHARSVAVAVHLAVGSRYEADEISGVSHFIEHMLFKGTQRRPTAEAIAAAIEGVGGVFNASTGRELTTYWVKVARPHLDLALDVLADMLRGSLFDPRELEKERQVIIEEIGMTLDIPDDWVFTLANELQWPNHPLGREVIGTRETVSRIARDEMLRYMAEHYRPTNTVVAVAGNIEHQEVVTRVERLLGDWEPGPRPTFLPFRDGQHEPRARVGHREIEQAHFVLMMPGLNQNDPDRFTLQLLSALLGEGMSSRLFQEIRERRALAYNVYSFQGQLQDTGVFGVYAAVDPGRVELALQVVLEELDRLRQEPVSPEELARTKEYAKGRLLLGLEDTSAMASWVGVQEALRGEILTVDDILAAVDAVTVEDIQAMAQRIFRGERLNLAVVGPFEDGEEQFVRLLKL